MTMPAVRLTHLPCLVRKFIIVSVAVEETPANTNNGKPTPTPKNRNRKIFCTKSTVDTALANKIAINPGLHGTTIAPKKNPYRNALTHGFRAMGARPFGRNFQISVSTPVTNDRMPVTISIRLMTSRVPKAIGETIWTMLVKETSKRVVKTSPITNINSMTPVVIISPKRNIVFRPVRSPEICVDRYTKNPGYIGRTQTAPRGVANPSKNASHSMTSNPIIGSLSVPLKLVLQQT